MKRSKPDTSYPFVAGYPRMELYLPFCFYSGIFSLSRCSYHDCDGCINYQCFETNRRVLISRCIRSSGPTLDYALFPPQIVTPKAVHTESPDTRERPEGVIPVCLLSVTHCAPAVEERSPNPQGCQYPLYEFALGFTAWKKAGRYKKGGYAFLQKGGH
jgi:hypothetical protein